MSREIDNVQMLGGNDSTTRNWKLIYQQPESQHILSKNDPLGLQKQKPEVDPIGF